MTEKEIRNQVEALACIWENTYNDDTDRMFGAFDHENVEDQYYEFTKTFLNYYRTLRESPKYIYKYLAFYCNFEIGKPLIDYAVKDIANYFNYLEKEVK